MSDVRNYENLANAIVLQAVRDYRRNMRFLKRHPLTDTLKETVKIRKSERKAIYEKTGEKPQESAEERLLSKIIGCKREIARIERFFNSNWYSVLTDIPGRYLLSRLKEEWK